MKRNIPPLTALVFAEAVYRLGSFKLAAEEQMVTASAVSHQIRAIENRLGFVLFVRKARRSEPTEAGKRYLQVIGHLLTEIETATFAETNIESDIFIIRLQTTDSFANRWLVERLPQFLEQNEKVKVSVQTSEYNREFQAGYANIGLMYGARSDANLVSKRFLPEKIFPVCHPQLLRPDDDPVSIFQSAPLIIDSNLGVEWSEWFEEAGDEIGTIDKNKLSLGITYNHSHLALKAAQLGNGIALASYPLVKDALREKSLVAPFQPVIESDSGYFIVYSKSDQMPLAMQLFIRWLLKEANG